MQVSECQGKVRTYFISTTRSKQGNAGKYSRLGGRPSGRLTLAEVVFGLVQARQKEKIREINSNFGLISCKLKC